MNYPAVLEIETPEEVARWRPLVQWILAIPHMIVMWFLSAISGVVAVISWFVILFTGNMPEGLAKMQCMVLRYQQRLLLYAGFVYEDYPPFDFGTSFEDPGGSPVIVDVMPELEGRDRLTVGLRLFWMIPVSIWVSIVWIATSVVWFVAFFAVIVLGRWPEGMRGFVVKSVRLFMQVSAYGALLTDKYPPFGFTPDAPDEIAPPAPGYDA